MSATPRSAAGILPAPLHLDEHPRTRLPRDDIFFAGMGMLILGMVFLGFARTYYLAPMYHTHVRSLLVHEHGAVFSVWILLFNAQIWLVARHRIAWHKRLGIFGAALAVVMLVLGLLVATDSLSHGFHPPASHLDPRTFYAVPIFSIVAFAVLVGAALCVRSNGASHKRLILLATTGLMGPAIDRWPFALLHKLPITTVLIVDAMIFLVAGFDLWSRGRIHSATAKGGVFLIVVQHSMIPIGFTVMWHKFASLALDAWMKFQ